MTVTATSQTANQTPTDPTLSAAQLQQQILTAQQAQADARLKMLQDQQAALTGVLPASSAAPQSGAFTVSGTNPIDSQRLAYTELNTIAEKVAAKVTGSGPVLIYDQTEINSLVNYKSVLKVLAATQAQVLQLKKTFDQTDQAAQTLLTLPQPSEQQTTGTKAFAAVLAPGLALAGLKTVTDLIGMFRSNTNISFSTFTNDDAALAAAVASSLTSKDKQVYQPAVMPLDLTIDASPFMDQLSSIQTELIDLQNSAIVDQSKVQQVSDALGAYIQADQALQANTDQTKVQGLTTARETARVFALGLLGGTAAAQLDVPTASLWKSQRDQFLKALGQQVTSIGNMGSSFGTLQASLTAVTNTGSAALTAVLRAEKLMIRAKEPGVTILLVKTSVLGGSVVTRVNLFSGGHLLYTGGAIVNYTLFNADGKITASGVEVGDSLPKRDVF
jgi:hypothetical protein